MEYLKINNKDFSKSVNILKVIKTNNYNAETNAAGNTVIDFINYKRSIEVGFIPLNAETAKELQAELDKISVAVTFRNPATDAIETINCFTAGNELDYYTIQEDFVMLNAFSLTFTEL